MVTRLIGERTLAGNRTIKIISLEFPSVFTHMISFNPHSLVPQIVVEFLLPARDSPSTRSLLQMRPLLFLFCVAMALWSANFITILH